MASVLTLAGTLTAKPAGPVASRTRSKTDLAAELHAAAHNGDVNRVQQLLQAGVAVNGTMGPQGCTALHLAAAAGHPDVVQELLEKGADVTAEHIINGTPLLVALYVPAASKDSESAAGHVAVAALLLQAGADIFGRASGSGQSLAETVTYGDIARLQRLLAAGCNVKQQSASGRTLLHLAAQWGNEETVAMLLAHGAAVDVADEEGWTALLVAARKQHTAVVQQLLAVGAAATAVSKDGRTVLHCLVCAQYAALPSAAATGATQTLRDIMQLLINSGATVNAGDHSKLAPLHMAAMNGSTAAATVLLECGADASAMALGVSCLSAAAAAGHADMVQMLLDAGAGAGAGDALFTAVLTRRMLIIKLLLQHKGHPPALDAVVQGFAFELRQQQQKLADNGSILAILLLHFCLLVEKQRAIQPAAAVSTLFSRPAVAAINKDRPALSLALLRSWGEHTADVDTAQEKDLATIKTAAQQAYCLLAAADKAGAAAASPTAPPAVEPATARKPSTRISTRMGAAAAAVPTFTAKRRAR